MQPLRRRVYSHRGHDTPHLSEWGHKDSHRRKCPLLATAACAALLFAAPAAWADGTFYRVSLSADGQLNGTVPTGHTSHWREADRHRLMLPTAVVERPAEAFVEFRNDEGQPWRTLTPQDAVAVLIEGPNGQGCAGVLRYPKSDWSGLAELKFAAKPAADQGKARTEFLNARAAHYRRLLLSGAPGTAWFRHELRATDARLGKDSPNAAQANARRRANTDVLFPTSFDLFSGRDAVRENLQLDRPLVINGTDEATVELSKIDGITINEIDWQPLVKDLKPEFDPLASSIPADQHALFLPSFQAAVTLADLHRSPALPGFEMALPQAEDLGVLERYEFQMGLSVSTIARLVGPQLVTSIALTGADPYVVTGADVAVLFESPQPAVLTKLLTAQVSTRAAAVHGVQFGQGQVAGCNYQSAVTPDRRVSSYVADVGGVVVVTNSKAQLERLAAVAREKKGCIAGLSEFRYFRDRYRRGAGDETALLFLSDATIRRWCSPQYRIAESRRVRALAALAEIQADQFEKLATGQAKPGIIHVDPKLADLGEVSLTPRGVRSSVYNDLSFATPIVEMAMTKATKAEAEAYERWRDNYQANWRWAFDPIAARLGVSNEKLTADLTVMPLIAGTQYRQFIELSAGTKLPPEAGDPHDALAHVALALNRKSSLFRNAESTASTMMQGATFGWVGDAVSFFVDEDPVLAEIAKVPESERDRFFERNWWRMPVALQVEVSNGLRLTTFLAGLRTIIEQTAPGMVTWTPLSYKDQPYVKIEPTDRTKGQSRELADAAIYYMATGERLLVTVNEPLLKRSIDRQIAREEAKKAGKTVDPAPKQWIGETVSFRTARPFFASIGMLVADQYESELRRQSWQNLAILNEWKHRFPQEDPVKLHERYWHARLTCPAGGRYVWNDKWQTMESTVLGHPGQPKTGPVRPAVLSSLTSAEFGLSLSQEQLRARVVLERAPQPKK